MRTTHMLRHFLISLVFVMTLLIGLPTAQASIDDFISTYKEIEKYAPPGSLPIASADVIAYKSLFQCIEGGSDVIVCTKKFKESDAGKKATGDIPEAVWQVVDAYIAWKAGDVWGVVEHLGTAAMCAVLQVLAGGFDACGLIKELVALGETMLDAGKAAAKFFKDLGEGVFNAAKGAYCASPLSVLGGCGDSGPPPKPKAQIIYEQFFAPKVKPDGLIAIEAKDAFAFHKLKTQIEDQAMAKGYSKNDTLLASMMFTKAVDAQWTADIVNKVLKELAAERNNFNAVGRISLAADYAWNHYKKEWDEYNKGLGWPDWQSFPDKKVPLYCVERFEALGYGHVDRWINTHDEAKTLNVISHYQWCEKVFWEENKTKFAPFFKKHMETKCPDLGCSSKADDSLCDTFMGYVGLNCVVLVSAKDQSPPQVVGQPGSSMIAVKPPSASAKDQLPPTVVGKPPEGVIAALNKPNLSVTGVQVKIEPNCQSPQPAMTAMVTIKNSGGPLSANKGNVFIKEQGGANLGSAGIPIPAIGAGQTQTVNIPAITSQPYSSLEGSHPIQVILNPQSDGDQFSFNKPADPYMFWARFPNGHCRATPGQQPQAQPRPAQPKRR